MLSFGTDTHAGAGQQVTIRNGGGTGDDVTRLNQLVSIATGQPAQVGLVAKGNRGGVARGWLFQSGSFVSDLTGESLSPAALLAGATGGNETTYTLVPAGMARRLGIDRDPEIRARIERAERQEITQALLRREVLPRLTDEAVRARYDREYANRPAEEEVRARHILVPTEAEARTLLAELARGTAFEEVSRRAGTGAGQREAGDLGWFKRGDMVPEFANAAFAMQAGQTSTAPVRTQFGWHIIRVEERRSSSGPSFDESRETIREQLVQDEVNAALTRIRGQVNVQVMAPAAPPAPALLQGAQPPAPPPAPSPARR